tara:strand:+ start:281 stop:1168 length:888 start_codon:yes stop_codon:yes gene_type:complete
VPGYGAKDSLGNFYFKALGDGEIKLGNTSDDLIHVTGTLDVAGPANISSNLTISGSSSDTYLMIQSDADCGIRLVADVNAGSTENDNPYIDFFQDGGAPTNRAFAQASIGLIGDAGQKFSDSLANAFYLMAATSTNFDNAFQIATRRNTDDQKASRITIEPTQGYVGVHTNSPAHELEINGKTKSNHYVTAVTTQDLGNSTSNTLSTSSGVVLLDADSINGTEMMGQEVHSLVIPNGTSSGQRLSLVVKTTTNNVSIMPAGTISGSFGALNDSIGVTALEFIWISESSHNAWHQI